MIKSLMIAAPILLFLFKYILPSLAEKAYNNDSQEKEQIKIELLHFPVDLLFVSTSYAIPKIVEVVSALKSYAAKIKTAGTNAAIINQYQAGLSLAISKLNRYFAISILSIILISFFVLITKVAEREYFSGNKRGYLIRTIILYIISAVMVIVSIYL